MFEIISEASFSAAHRLVNYDGPCEEFHGHNWMVRAFVRCETLNDIGLGIDFRDLKKALNTVLDRLDHKDLNKVFGETIKNPSSELISQYIYKELRRIINTERVKIHRVEVFETPGNCAAYFENS